MYVHATAWADVNGDGWQDLFVGTFAGGAAVEYAYRGATGASPDRLLIGGPAGFTPDTTFPTMFGRTASAGFADLDNDGDPDLVIGRLASGTIQPVSTPSAILRNDGGRFVISASLSPTLQGRSVGILDYDADRRLDLYLPDDWYGGGTGILYHNDGGLSFSDATQSAGLAGVQGFGVAASDITNDGRPDLVVGGTLSPGYGPASSRAARIFTNAGSGRFHEVDNSAFVWGTNGIDDNATAATVADVNRDGLPDLLLGQHYDSTLSYATYPPTTTGVTVPIRLYLHQGMDSAGQPRFVDVTQAAGLPSFPTKSPDVQVVDVDNDSWPDIVTTASSSAGQAPSVLRSLGTNKQGVPRFASPQGLGDVQYWVTTPPADVDRDGRMDLVLGEWYPQKPTRLLRNSTVSGHWLGVEVADAVGGVGTLVEVYCAGQVGHAAALMGVQQVQATSGYASGIPTSLHFGAGSVTSVDVRLTSPDGSQLIRSRVLVDQLLRIRK